MKAKELEDLPRHSNLDRRREPRLSISFPIEVSGFDRNGKFFSERTTTDDISDHGCRFQLQAELDPTTVVAVKVLRPDGPLSEPTKLILYQIARVQKGADGSMIGAAKLQSENIWCVTFPDPKAKNRL